MDKPREFRESHSVATTSALNINTLRKDINLKYRKIKLKSKKKYKVKRESQEKRTKLREITYRS